MYTIPFIARYRKEATGALNDEVLRSLYDRLNYLRNLEEKKHQEVFMDDKKISSPATPPYENRRSPGMATASLVLGILSLATSFCLYFALPCGALGIILALLSRIFL